MTFLATSGACRSRLKIFDMKETTVETQNTQVDALAVIDALTVEIAALTRRAVVAEQQVAALMAEKTEKQGKESK